MSFSNIIRQKLKESLEMAGLSVRRRSSNQIRGIDPLLDVKFLIQSTAFPTFFDVGANDGSVTAALLAQFPNATIVAFEPFRACFDQLTRRFASRSAVRIENLALGSSTGEGKLNVYSSNRMNSLLELERGPSNIMREYEKTSSAAVAVDTLDNFCSREGIDRVDLLKVDTQGYDLKVLQGASRLLSERRIKTILLEVNFVAMYEKQPSFIELHTYLSSFSYNLVDFYNHVWQNGHTAWCDACYNCSPD